MNGELNMPTTIDTNIDHSLKLDYLSEATFREGKDQELERLQGEIDAVTTKTVSATYEPYRDTAENLLRTLRIVFGQVARFAEGNFRENANFYLGQLHALAEVAERVRRLRLPKQAMGLITRKEHALQVLRVVTERETIGASDLAREIGIQESNLSVLCKELSANELLRADRFGKRVRYSPTPLTHAVLANIGKPTPETSSVPPDIELASKTLAAAASAASVGVAPDLSKTMAEAAAASLGAGNVMSNTNDFASGLFALGGLRGADAVVIDPSGKEIRIESRAFRKSCQLLPPKSIRESLSQQTKSFLMFEGVLDSNRKPCLFTWRGQRVRVASEPTPVGKRFRLEFVDNVLATESKEKIQIAYREIEQEKGRLEDFQKFYVRQVWASCGRKDAAAAETLGIKAIELRSILK
jgi:hypothetical protein